MRSQRQRIRMTEAEVSAFLASQRKISVATLNPDGSAHVMPMYYVMVEGRVAFWSYTKSQKIRNLQRDPRVTVMAEAGDAYFDLRGVQIRGLAHVSADPAVVLPVWRAALRPAVRPADGRVPQPGGVHGPKEVTRGRRASAHRLLGSQPGPRSITECRLSVIDGAAEFTVSRHSA